MSIKDIKESNWFFGASVIALLVWFLLPSRMSPSDLIAHALDKNEGLIKHKNTGLYEIKVLHKPVDFILAQEYQNGVLEADNLSDRKEKLTGLQYYNMRISVADNPSLDVTTIGAADFNEQQGRLKYLNFGLQNDIQLVENGDTLSPVLFHFENTYNLTAHRNFVIAFPQDEAQKYADKTFIIDSAPLNTGVVKSFFDGTKIQSFPKLKI